MAIRYGATQAAIDNLLRTTTGKPQARLWARIGRNIPDPTTGEVTFVKTPYDLALDTMPHLKEYNSEKSQFFKDQNDLLDELIQLADTLEEGEEKEITLTVKLYKSKQVDTTERTKKSFGLEWA